MRSTLFAILALTLTAPAGAFQRFDFDQRYFIEPGYIVKDHTTVRAADGTIHLFYIKADETLPEAQRAKALGHATTTDFSHWTIHPEVVPVVPDTWEESFVWAPHIVPHQGVYFMYYTGVNRHYAQAIGLAVSSDLFAWSKHPSNPVYTPSTTWAAWTPTTWSNCRDPYVFQDNGLWYLLTTAWTNTSRGAISLASSTNLVEWTDLGPLLVHPGPQAWHVLESANLHRIGNTYSLFMTEQDVGGSVFLQAGSLQGPWDYGARQPFDAGHAIELFTLDGQWMLSRHTTFTFEGTPRYVIKYDDILWPQGRPTTVFVDPLAGWTFLAGDAFYLQPTFWDNSRARGGASANFGGNSWIGTYELFTGPLQVGFPGQTAGDEPRGIIRSPAFTLTGNRLAFRVGGGSDIDRLYVALGDAATGQKLLRATGSGSDTMQETTWDVGPWIGRTLHVEIADLAADGHINVDEIVESHAEPTHAPPPGALRAVLHANAPNPFNPQTRLGFDLPAAGHVRLAVHDVRGRLVRTLVDERLGAGKHQRVWDGTDAAGRGAASGVYYCLLRLDGGAALARPMVLLK